MNFSLTEERLFAEAAEALVDQPVQAASVAPFLRAIASRAPARVAWGLRAILWLGWAAPIALGPARRTFTRLSREERAQLWSAALDHRAYLVRQLALAAKAMVCLCLFDEDARPRAPRGGA